MTLAILNSFEVRLLLKMVVSTCPITDSDIFKNRSLSPSDPVDFVVSRRLSSASTNACDIFWSFEWLKVLNLYYFKDYSLEMFHKLK